MFRTCFSPSLSSSRLQATSNPSFLFILQNTTTHTYHPSCQYSFQKSVLPPSAKVVGYAFVFIMTYACAETKGESVARSATDEDDRSFGRVLQSNSFILYTVVLNPIFVVHVINGLLSLLSPDDVQHLDFTTSIRPHFDVHMQDGLCRVFTLMMVALQSVLCSSHSPRNPAPSVKSEDDGDRRSDA